MHVLFRLLAIWPLPLLHALGWCVGWGMWLGSRRYRQRWAQHTAWAGLSRRERWLSVGAAGKQITELPRLWFGAPVHVGWKGAAHIEAALQQNQGILFLTPHMGCFEVTAQAYAQRFGVDGQSTGHPTQPMTVLFRPPRNVNLLPVLQAARQRPGLLTAPTTLRGVRQLAMALKAGQAVGLLPDQVPPEGLGVWAPFFGHKAYTMTLSARLAQIPGTQVLLAWGERLPWGRGYVVHVQTWDDVMGQPMELRADEAAAQVNQAMEHLVAQKPEQYLWGYARYKQPRKDW